MNPRRVRWLAVVVMLAGVMAVAANVLSSSPHEGRLATTTPPPVAKAPSTSRSTMTAARPATSTTALPTTAMTELPAPATTTAPEAIAPSTPAPAAEARPVAITSEPQPTTTTAPPLPEVAIYGDSLTILSSERYHEIADSEVNTHEHAFMGATLPLHRDVILSDPVNRLVLALGTNDAEHEGAQPWADFFNQLPATKCVVWPKPYEGSNNMTVFNTQVSAIVAAHPNVHVIDWNARAKPHPEWLEPDNKHYASEGRNQYAAMLKEAALTCP